MENTFETLYTYNTFAFLLNFVRILIILSSCTITKKGALKKRKSKENKEKKKIYGIHNIS